MGIMGKKEYKEACQPEGNYFDKYGSNNPIVKRLMKGYFDSFGKLLGESGISRGGYILEAGCGEGHVAAFMQKKIEGVLIDAFDISEKVIREAEEEYSGIHFFVHNIYDGQGGKQYDLIVCSEVLEHMEQPKNGIRNLMKNGEKFIFSVPHEPVWRMMNVARGKYIRDFGNTPGHIQHFTKKSFYRMLTECGLEVIQYERPLPWLMVYCRKIE